jgi:transcriptional regulator with XRE-family HTH domain
MRTYCKRNLRTDESRAYAHGADMFASNVPHRLKALREAANLSIRKLAAELGMSSSGYAHYETPARFKDQYLPMQMAIELVRILRPHGVPAPQIMALAGVGANSAEPRLQQVGFAEDAAKPWTPRQGDGAKVDTVIAALAPRAGHAGTFQMPSDIMPLGLLRGDILIVDLKRLPQRGELALAYAKIDGDELVAVVGRYLPPMIFTSESLTDGKILDVSTDSPAFCHPILASFRSTSGT